MHSITMNFCHFSRTLNGCLFFISFLFSFTIEFANLQEEVQNSPKQPHHAASSCPNRPASCGWQEFSKNAPNPQILYGALVSGPDEVDLFKDCREEYAYTEVTLDYNAGFTSALAGLLQLQLKNADRRS